jgi:ribosomal protein S18 acetylase RimI-like enzyme
VERVVRIRRRNNRSAAKAGSTGSLWLYTFARNVRACRFYEKHGFVAVEHGFESHWQLEDIKYSWSASSKA